MRRLIKILTGRMMLIGPLFLLQFAAVAALLYRVTIAYRIMPVVTAASFLITIMVVNSQTDPSYKIAWIILVLALPVVGVPLYAMAANRKMPKKLSNGTIRASQKMEGLLIPDESILPVDEESAHVFRYAMHSGFPVFQNTECRYFSSGEEWSHVYLEELKKAEHYIFMEFFIIDEGSFWDEVLEILKEKAKAGVEVKIIYDDFGSITLPWHYDRTLRSFGIEAYRFNHVRPALIFRMNNRSHRKLTIIDNKVAFTGGVNLADEYVGREERFGKWKDSALMLRGEAVWSMTVMFMGMLTYVRGDDNPVDYEHYHLPCDKVSDGGWYQPYSDTPTDTEPVAMNMHLNMIAHANRYIYIDTPYLILTEAMKNELTLAARNGVDVRILTPHIADKKLVFMITRSHYLQLLEGGVRIYEYTPGFNHTKNFVSDDKMAIIGSANTDYRSYFLHFENGVLLHNTPEIIRIREDFEKALEVSHEVTVEEMKETNVVVRMMQALLSVFIPLI
ncbi:MAG: cardiolipin synthase [Erysipelotrichaceae bacterium]|nr:cardiolipin synthase [Erysipelotrichaceae bacterium]